MSFRSTTALAVFLGGVLCLAPTAGAASPRSLTLPEAFERTLRQHPALAATTAQRDVSLAERDGAALTPGSTLQLDAENFAGSGALRGVDGAEVSLTLASVLEPRARRDARIAVADARVASIDDALAAQRLDLLADVARRYLDVLAAQAERVALQASLRQRDDTVAAARRRLQAGASPRSVLLAAEAAQARTKVELALAVERQNASRRRLALAWGDAAPDFDVAAGDLAAVPATEDFATLAARLQRNPELLRFANEQRLREAQRRLAASATRGDLGWQVGLRRLQGDDAWALTAGVSVPLGEARRAAPALRAADADLRRLGDERAAGERDLLGTLAEAHARQREAADTVRLLGADVLPLLRDAERSAADAFRAGAASRLEWAQLQADTLAVERERIAAARDAHLALIQIQRLTAEPMLAGAADEEYSR